MKRRMISLLLAFLLVLTLLPASAKAEDTVAEETFAEDTAAEDTAAEETFAQNTAAEETAAEETFAQNTAAEEDISAEEKTAAEEDISAEEKTAAEEDISAEEKTAAEDEIIEKPEIIEEPDPADETSEESPETAVTEEEPAMNAYSGSCGENLAWTLSDAGVLTISGSGAMTDYQSVPNIPWNDYRESIRSVVAENGVTHIGKNAFYGCTSLTSVSLPDSLDSIGAMSYQRCSALTEITIPANVTGIEYSVFAGCTGLTKVTFLGSAPAMGSGLFRDVTAMAWYPAGDTSWTSEILQDYDGSITWVNGTCGDDLYWALADGTLTISGTGDMVNYERGTETPWYVCRDDIASVVIKNGVTSIGNKAFHFEFGAIESVSIPESVTSIGDYAFFKCLSLAYVYIPEAVTKIDYSAFAYCSSLSYISVSMFNENYTEEDGVLFNKNKTELLQYPIGNKAKSYVVPSGVTGIGSNAFSYDEDLSEVTLPDTLTDIGMYAFLNSGLNKISIPASVKYISRYAFEQCFWLKTITFEGNPPGYIADDAFRAVTATAYYPPTSKWTESVRRNYGGTLTWSALEPTSVLCGDDLFWKLQDTKLTITGSGDMWDFSEAPWYNKRENISELVLPDGMTSIGNKAFYGFSALKSVTLPGKLTRIGQDAFYNSGLTDAAIPKGVTKIEENAFLDCKGLKTVTIPEGVTKIASYAFSRCTGLKSVALPGSLIMTSSDAYVFSGCTSLTSAVLSEGITVAGNGLFYNCSDLTEVTLPQSLTSIEDSAFYGCKLLKSVTIPDAVTTIKDVAFYYCESLTSVTIPAGVKSIGSGAFNLCSRLKILTFKGSAPAFNGTSIFTGDTVTAYYPADDSSWTEEVKQGYGGTITWTGVYDRPLVTLAASTKGVAVSWTEPLGSEKYQIQRSIEGDKWKSLGNAAEPAYTDADVTMGVTYAYRVRAYVDGAWGKWSDSAGLLFNPFTDVPSSGKTLSYVSWAYNNGIVNGTSTTTFSPDNSCTRVQFVMMLWKMAGTPTVKNVTNPFKDVTDGTKTCKAVLWALDKGIINSSNTFNPNGNITRIQVVMILWKMAGSPKVTGKNPFTDISGAKTINAVMWAYKKGITKGTSATTFSPSSNCTRLQLVVFLYKST